MRPHRNPATREQIIGLYTGVLKRAPREDEIQIHLGGGLSYPELALTFVESEEFQALTSWGCPEVAPAPDGEPPPDEV